MDRVVRGGGALLLFIAALFYSPFFLWAQENGGIILTGEDIRAMKAHKMADVLNQVPGVTAGDKSVGIHGSYKVKVFVDGRPINDPTSSHGGVNWDMVSPDEIEKLEILKGKGGLRYGQDASGGVILITTKSVRRLTGNIKAYGGNYGTGYAKANMQMKEGPWTAGGAWGFEATDGYKINNDKERTRGSGKLSYAFGEDKSLSFSADYMEDERGLSGLPNYPTPFSRKESKNTNISLGGVYKNISSTAFFNEGRNHNTDHTRGIDQTLKVSEWGEDLSWHMETEKWGELSLGGGYLLGRASGATFDDQREETFSAFSAHSFSWARIPLSVSLGLRANINTAFEDALNPEVKATWKKEEWSLSASYSRSNNTPSFRQRYNRTSSTRPNPELTMETSDNYNLGLSVKLSDFLSCGFSLFHNRLSDRITYVSGDGGVGQYQNVGLVTYTGGDTNVSLTPHKIIKIKGSYTYLEARDHETDLWLSAKARHKVNFSAYLRPAEPVSLVVSGKYSSKVYRNKKNTKSVPEYFTSDVRAEYAFKGFSLFGQVKNLFDKHYYYADGLIAPPQTWILGMNWRI